MASKGKNSLKGASSQRLQPIRATEPFHLRQGSPARKSPSSSPTPALSRPSSDVRRNKWSTSPDRGATGRRSPNSPSVKVPSSHRSPSPRIWSHMTQESPVVASTITNTYLTGQWPRGEPKPTITNSCCKSTQTNPNDWHSDTKTSKSSSRQQYNENTKEVKQMKQQMRRIAKNRHEKKDRQSPVHGNHTALSLQQPSQPRQISTFGRGPRRHNSVEGLNKEIENIYISKEDAKPAFGVTPPDGHRAPLPRSSTRTMETQTPQEFHQEGGASSPSPSPDQQTNTSANNQLKQDVSPHPKYASSPRPNNSYMFKREPPEGAESIKPFKEQEAPTQNNLMCPDKQKVHFQPSKLSRFLSYDKVVKVAEPNNNSKEAKTVDCFDSEIIVGRREIEGEENPFNNKTAGVV